MEKSLENTVIGLLNGYGLLFETLVNRLHATGALNRPALCDELEAVAAKAERDWGEHPEIFDLRVIRTLIVSLRGEDQGPSYELPISRPIQTAENANDNPES